MTRRRILLAVALSALAMITLLTVIGTGQGERPNALAPTLGGAQFWNDEILLGGWRVQRHVGTGHCRLLDDSDMRRAWGTEQECAAALVLRATDSTIGQNAKRMTILIHGLGGYSWTFRTMEPALTKAGVHAEHWNYASTRGSLADHVAAFHNMMNHLEGVEEISFVAHSLGGLLLRQALADRSQAWRPRIRVTGMVMIGMPNQGAALADRFKNNQWFKLAFEDAGQDLTSGYAATIPMPSVPYHPIAGKLEGEGNPLIPGADDGMVAVDEVRLKASDEMLIIKGNHLAITADEHVIKFVISSLFSGKLP